MAGGCLLPFDTKLLLPESSHTLVEAESQEDEDPLERVDCREDVPEFGDVGILADEAKDPSETHHAGELKIGAQIKGK